MVRSALQGESDSSIASVGVTGLALASQPGSAMFGVRDVGPPGSAGWVSDDGATNHLPPTLGTGTTGKRLPLERKGL